MVDEGDCRQPGRIVHVEDFTLGRVNFVRNVRNGCNYVHIKLAEEPLLDDFQV